MIDERADRARSRRGLSSLLALVALGSWSGAPTAVLIASPPARAAEEAPAHDSIDAAEASLADFFNNGEDFTRPRNQARILQRYQRDPDVGGREPDKWTTTPRVDLWTDLGRDWLLYGRADLPFVRTNDVTSSFNPEGRARFGVGDLLTEIALVAPPPTPRLAYGLGVRAVWPTAGLNETGSGKYQIGPVAAVRLGLPELTPGSFVAPQAYYLNSLASRNENKGRADINQLSIQPKINVALPDDWFVLTYANQAIQINYADEGKLFVPLDVMVGTRVLRAFIASIEYSRALVHDRGFEPYQWLMEGRIGYFF